MSVEPKFVELATDVVTIFLLNICKLGNQTRKNTIAGCCYYGGLVVQNTWYQACFYFLISSLIFGYLVYHKRSICMMGTPRTNTNVRVKAIVLPALLVSVVEFCLVCLVCGLCCCSSSFWSVCFLFVVPCVVYVSFSFPSCSRLRGKEEGALFLPVMCRWSSMCHPFRIVRSPCEFFVR